ncbi:MAG: diaminopimelate epimerase [Anaerolineales bacterium]|nr:diaminopimelate epimerase [Anaerolineales bacterium]
MRFVKYHALGNDYLVIHQAELTETQIQRICHRNYGLGADGILLGPLESKTCDFGLRIFNPDGSEAEKSGNGLRIFSRYLWDEGLVRQQPFTVETLGGAVTCQVGAGGRDVAVNMGKVCFDGDRIPVLGSAREVLRERMKIGDREFEFCAATVGNPHCIVLCDDLTPELAKRYGPLIETEARFPNRTNVQFMRVLDQGNIRIEIWERGAGYTLASGSSSTAAAATAYKLGLCDADITVHMPGGKLKISIAPDYSATLHGPVTRICNGSIDQEMFEERQIQ